MPIKIEPDDWDPLETWPLKDKFCENFSPLLSSFTADNSFNLSEYLAFPTDANDNKKYVEFLDSKKSIDVFDIKPYESDFEEYENVHDLEELTFNPPILDELDESNIYKKAFLIRFDCKLSGCDENCRKTHRYNYESDNENFDFDYYDGLPLYQNHQPYTPITDHSYSQPMPSIKEEPQDSSSDNDIDVTGGYHSQSMPLIKEEPQDSPSDTDVDVTDYEDVINEWLPVPTKKVRPKRQYIRRKPYNNNKTFQCTVKAAATALKRTRYQSRNATKKQKISSVETTPTSSLPSSRDNSVSRYSSDAEDYEKRTTHNISERKRREAQKDALQNLRVSIPRLKDKPKTSKVVILKTACEVIKEYEQEAAYLEYEKELLMKRKIKLLHKLQKKLNKYYN